MAAKTTRRRKSIPVPVARPLSARAQKQQAVWRAQVDAGRKLTVLLPAPAEKMGPMTIEDVQRELNKIMFAPVASPPPRMAKRGEEPGMMS